LRRPLSALLRNACRGGDGSRHRQASSASVTLQLAIHHVKISGRRNPRRADACRQRPGAGRDFPGSSWRRRTKPCPNSSAKFRCRSSRRQPVRSAAATAASARPGLSALLRNTCRPRRLLCKRRWWR